LSKAFGIAFGAAVIVIGVAIWLGFAKTAGNHLVPTGSIGKVRTVKADDMLTYMVVDFQLKNDSDVDMTVRSIQSEVDTADGQGITGGSVASRDVKAAFDSYPALGEQYNAVLKERDTIPAHQSVDRMVGLRFDAPVEKVDGRKRLVLRIEDITGPVVEMTK
jgi:hypothetical protein